MLENIKIAVIGLGYVGLPLAVEFGKKYKTVGFDIESSRVNELNLGRDNTNEVLDIDLKKVLNNKFFSISDDSESISDCNFYIITVPTPVDINNRPIFDPLISASKLVGRFLNQDDIVVYESTVYPGATEEICVNILEKFSNKIFNKDFFVGYSPERINPGDKVHSLTKIKKVTSGSNDATAEKVDKLYKSIITAGTFKASSIKVAEASKVIENSQRDINIAFVNELAKIFKLLNIDTLEVLEAAGTKWNFLPFKPGLVGGHCIGVDPYYLAQKAQEVGYFPEIILAGRKLNDSMGKYIASEVIKLMIKNSIQIIKSEILILGFSFKENCPDFRNTKVIDIIRELKDYEINLTVVDPLVDPDKVFKEYGLKVISNVPKKINFDAAILAVSHDEFHQINLTNFIKDKPIFDVKGFYKKSKLINRL